jgi:hypothetical protein
MKLRWHPASAERDSARRHHYEGGSEAAEYVEGTARRDTDDAVADRNAWYRARHWSADRHPSDRS